MSRVKNRIEEILRQAIDGADVDVAQDSDQFIATIRTRGQTAEIPVVWAGEGWPDDVRRAIKEAPSTGGGLVVMARRISTGSLELLESTGFGWADETGASQIASGGLIVMRDQSLEAASESDISAEMRWSPSAMDVAEALLSLPRDSTIRLAEVADLTGWSVPQVSKVIVRFEREGWVQNLGDSRGRGSSKGFADWEGLLQEWSAAVSEAPLEAIYAHTLDRDLFGFLERVLAAQLDEQVEWSLTGWAAAEQVSPIASLAPVLQINVDSEKFGSDLIDSIGLSAVDYGGAIELRRARRVTVRAGRTTKSGIRLASPARIYADLLALGGRGEDVATHVKREVLDLDTGSKPPPVEASVDLGGWEFDSMARFTRLMNDSGDDSLRDIYRNGYWTTSYSLPDAKVRPKLPELREWLFSAQGNETGWPVWITSGMSGSSERIFDDLIERWLVEADIRDPGDADFWRASPHGDFFLMRGYDEDGPHADHSKGAVFDLTLPIWRTGECLLHASRMASMFGADNIEVKCEWHGLRGRELSAWASRSRHIRNGRRSAQDSVATVVVTSRHEIANQLERPVRDLVEPLFAVFDFFEPAVSIYSEELALLRGDRNRR